MYFRSVFVWFVVGGFFGDGLYFVISKIYESRFNGFYRQRSYQFIFVLNLFCFVFLNLIFMLCNLAIRWIIDSLSSLSVAVCSGGRQKRSLIRVSVFGVISGSLFFTMKLLVFSVTFITLFCGLQRTALFSKFRINKFSNSGCSVRLMLWVLSVSRTLIFVCCVVW